MDLSLSPQTSRVKMAPKRARTAAANSSASSSSQPANAAATKLTLHGGVPHHPSLAGLWREERLTDFAVCAEGVEFKAHRVALASSSKYFLNLFESGMRDAADATHALEDIRPKALEALLAFIYEGKCEIDEGLLAEVLEASARLVVDALKDACAHAIGARLAPSNALNVWRLADTFTLPALEKAAVGAAQRGFEELPAQLATGAEVLSLVQEDRLVARSEEAVFQWCVRWWEAAERPEAELLAVMKHVRFAVMAASFLHGTVRAWPALDSKDGQRIFCDAMLPAVDGTKVVPRSGFGPRLIYVVGGHGGGSISKVELYDPQVASWTQLASMTVARSFHSCAALDGKLYAVGGCGATCQTLDTAEVYDPQTDIWQPLAKMATERSAFGLAAVGGKVYAIGGWGGDEDCRLESVEAYDPQLGSWAPVASMSAKREFHASVVLDGKIYVMGGRGEDGVTLDMAEVYDPQADSWQRVASMPQGLYIHAAAAMGGKIYVTGGAGGDEEVENSVFVYDLQADAWTQLASMSIARSCHASAAVGGKLYVFGGVGSNEGLVFSMTEVYDPASDSWVQGTSLTSAGQGLVAVAL
jgi:N-acetylneuraminic acid mutarotase